MIKPFIQICFPDAIQNKGGGLEDFKELKTDKNANAELIKQ